MTLLGILYLFEILRRTYYDMKGILNFLNIFPRKTYLYNIIKTILLSMLIISLISISSEYMYCV